MNEYELLKWKCMNGLSSDDNFQMSSVHSSMDSCVTLCVFNFKMYSCGWLRTKSWLPNAICATLSHTNTNTFFVSFRWIFAIFASKQKRHTIDHQLHVSKNQMSCESNAFENWSKLIWNLVIRVRHMWYANETHLNICDKSENLEFSINLTIVYQTPIPFVWSKFSMKNVYAECKTNWHVECSF